MMEPPETLQPTVGADLKVMGSPLTLWGWRDLLQWPQGAVVLCLSPGRTSTQRWLVS